MQRTLVGAYYSVCCPEGNYAEAYLSCKKIDPTTNDNFPGTQIMLPGTVSDCIQADFVSSASPGAGTTHRR